MSSGIVHVIDDDEALRDSVAFLLRAAGYSVQPYDSAQSFLRVVGTVEPGCILTDVRMPGMDGMELLRVLREAGHTLPVIVMTGHGDVPLAVRAMKLGAVDFVEKPFEDEVLIDTVRTALALGTGPASSHVDEELASRVATLSQREKQVLTGLVGGRTNKEIARQFDLSPRTVEVYRAKLMAKMQASNISELVRFAVRAGVATN